MKPPKQKKSELLAQSERKVLELTAQLPSSYYFANQHLGGASTRCNKGSGVILQLTAIGGLEIIKPVLISDGLSEETIAAIKSDLKRSLERATELKL